LNGCIAYLGRTRPGSLYDRAVVSVLSTTLLPPAPDAVLDLTSPESFRSRDLPYEWILWVFHFRDITLEHYTIRSDGLRSWVLEGSKDREEWRTIDRRSNTTHFKEGMATATFRVWQRPDCRYIRLVQTGRNHQGTNVLSVSAVEFFGVLFELRPL
jgi:hypothetical protein